MKRLVETLEHNIVARLQHAQIKTYAVKSKANDNIQRNNRAADQHAFEHALKVASSEKSEKVGSAIGSPDTSEFVFNLDEQDDHNRHNNLVSLTAGAFQSVQYADPFYAGSESVLENRTHFAKEFFDNQGCDSAICADRLEEVSDWLDEILDREGDSADGWTFEFETDDAQLVKLQLFCQQDGQWSACINLDASLNDQQELELMLSKKGVALSRTNFS